MLNPFDIKYMKKEFREFSTGATLKIGDFELLQPYTKNKRTNFFTVIRTLNESLYLEVDNLPLQLQPKSMLVLTPDNYLQSFEASDSFVYQFNRDFYCIKDHDREVSCAGLLFYGNDSAPLLHLPEKDISKLDLLHQVFLEELETVDNIQAEMLRMLTARLVITATRLIKLQRNTEITEKQSDLLRNFNVLVETYFRTEHAVGFYAEKLFKSPKTLSNTFSKYNKSPLQIIHDRIILEAKRLLIYSDKTNKEIAYELGFDDASHLSRMFKKHTNLSPTHFKKNSNLISV